MQLLELRIFQLPDFQIATEKPGRQGQLSSELQRSLFHFTIQQAFIYCHSAMSAPWLRTGDVSDQDWWNLLPKLEIGGG